MLDWDKERIKRNLDNLILSGSGIEDDELVKVYKSYLYNQEMCEEDDLSKKMTQKEVFDKLETQCYLWEYFLGKFLPKKLSRNILEIVEVLGPLFVIKSFSGKLDSKNIGKNILKEDDLMKRSAEVYNSVSSLFEMYSTDLFKNNFIKYQQPNDLFMPYDCSCCYYDNYNTCSHIWIQRQNNYALETLANHEIAHAIVGKINDRINTTYLSEVHSIYMTFYTDKKLYEQTKDKKYLISSQNYLKYLQSTISLLAILNEISRYKAINYKNVDKALSNLGVYVYDIKSYTRDFADINFFNKIVYFLSSVASLHLLLLDEEKANSLFSKSIFDEFRTYNKFFKDLEFKLSDPVNASLIYNQVICENEQMIRMRK